MRYFLNSEIIFLAIVIKPNENIPPITPKENSFKMLGQPDKK